MTNFIQNKLLEETVILAILTKHPKVSGYGITRRCREIGFMVHEATINQLIVKMIERGLVERRGRTHLIITRIGESNLLSNRYTMNILIN